MANDNDGSRAAGWTRFAGPILVGVFDIISGRDRPPEARSTDRTADSSLSMSCRYHLSMADHRGARSRMSTSQPWRESGLASPRLCAEIA